MEYLSWSLLLLGGLVLLIVYFVSRSQRTGEEDTGFYDNGSPEHDRGDVSAPPPKPSPVISESDARSHVLSNLSHELETINQLLGRRETERGGAVEPDESSANPGEYTEPSLPVESALGDLFDETADPGPKLTDKAPAEKIITLHICARNNEQISGGELFRIFNERSYEFGEMDIFHSRFDGITIFSIVNMVEPGSFDLASMDEFSTPGISLFLRLPGPLAADVAFDVLLNEAREIASQLDAVILDASRSTLTLQMERHIHEELKQFDFKQKRGGDN